MARTELTVGTIDRAGLEPAMTALIADGHKFRNDGKLTRIMIVNGATPLTLTIQTPDEVDGLAVAERTVAIGAGGTYEIGPFQASLYNQPDGMVYIDYDNPTDGSVNVARLGY